MIALDTNVLVRYLLADDERQHRAAVALLAEAAECWLPVTVVLELEWVLRTRRIGREDLERRLRELLALANVRAQHAEAVNVALAWYRDGMDFADALHLALSQQAASFATFDEKLVKRAKALKVSPVVTPA